MTKTTSSGATALKFVVLTVVLLGIGFLGCLFLLPRYEKVEAQILLAEAMGALARGQTSHEIAELNQVIALNPQSFQAYAYRGLAYTRVEEYDKSIADFRQALRIDPQNEQILFSCGFADESLGDFKSALTIYNQAINYHPQSAMAYNNLAWLLATCPNAEYRDGKKAVDLASKACDLSEWKNPASLDTLAAAYAEIGDFDQALKWENVALSFPDFSATDASGARDRLTLYQGHQAYHRPQ